jgi:hypothetical protein
MQWPIQFWYQNQDPATSTPKPFPGFFAFPALHRRTCSRKPETSRTGFANFCHHVLGSELGTLHLLLYPLLLVYGLRQIGIWVDELYDLVRLARTIDQLSLK